LKLYQKQKLKEQIEAWLDKRYDEYKGLNNEFLKAQIKSIRA
jgi:hypothetical protein